MSEHPCSQLACHLAPPAATSVLGLVEKVIHNKVCKTDVHVCSQQAGHRHDAHADIVFQSLFSECRVSVY